MSNTITLSADDFPWIDAIIEVLGEPASIRLFKEKLQEEIASNAMKVFKEIALPIARFKLSQKQAEERIAMLKEKQATEHERQNVQVAPLDVASLLATIPEWTDEDE